MVLNLSNPGNSCVKNNSSTSNIFTSHIKIGRNREKNLVIKKSLA